MNVRILQGDCRETLKTLPDASVHCCVTSPPYWGLRDYGHDGQLGLEPTPEAYVANMVAVFREVRRVLRDDGTLWLNLGDSYTGSVALTTNVKALSGKQGTSRGTHGNIPPRDWIGLKPKDLVGIPWRVAFALQSDGWYLRQDIIWAKPNPMPESVTDRCTKAHEYIFLLSKSARYYFDAKAIAEERTESSIRLNGYAPVVASKAWYAPKDRNDAETSRKGSPNGNMRNRRSVWTVATSPYKGAHFATYPPKLIEPCILAGCPVGGTVLDPFGGSGTTGIVANMLGREAILCELNPKYVELIRERRSDTAPLLMTTEAA